MTAEIEQSDDYRDVLLGVARTVTFTAPETDTSASPPHLPSDSGDVRNIFG